MWLVGPIFGSGFEKNRADIKNLLRCYRTLHVTLIIIYRYLGSWWLFGNEEKEEKEKETIWHGRPWRCTPGWFSNVNTLKASLHATICPTNKIKLWILCVFWHPCFWFTDKTKIVILINSFNFNIHLIMTEVQSKCRLLQLIFTVNHSKNVAAVCFL